MVFSNTSGPGSPLTVRTVKAGRRSGSRKPDKDSLWWHYQVIIVPKHFSDDLGDKGYMQIEAGSNNGNPPNIQSNEDIDMAKVSLRFSS